MARKSTFDFTEIVNNYGLKQGAVCQIVRFISKFSQKLCIKSYNLEIFSQHGLRKCSVEVTVKKIGWPKFLARLLEHL